MQLSNRLTFSLASLIFLIAFGLVFGTTSVMAHEDATADSATTPRVHSHPLVETLSAQTDSDATPNDLGTAVTPHDHHPTVMSIVAKPDAAGATLRTSDGRNVIFLAADGTALDVDTAGAAGTPGTFNVRFTFMGTLADNGDTTVDDNEGLDADEISFRARRADGTLIDVSSGVTSTVTAVPDEKNKFDVAIAVPSTIYWDSTATPAASRLPIEIFIDIEADAVATGTTVNDDGVTLNPASSYAYMSNALAKFTIVDMFDMPKPTVEVRVPDDAGLTAPFEVTLMFSKAVDMLTANDLVVTGGLVGTPAKDTTKTDGTVWKVTVTHDGSDATEITIAVNVEKAIAHATMGMATVMAKDDDSDTDTGAMLADKGYLIIVRDMDNAPDFGTTNPDMMEWEDMPDLHELFIQNALGGGSLQLTATGVSGARKMVFSEIMWGIDEGQVGTDDADKNQWIEIYNRSGAAVAHSDITITAKEGRPALVQGLDLVSNVVGGGADWIGGKGQNGNTGGTDTNGNIIPLVEFISMYRTRLDREGWLARDWGSSAQLYMPNFRGSPGGPEPKAAPVIGATNANRGPVIFNEISNTDNPDHEWIELRNVSDGTVNLKNYEVTIVTSKGPPPQDDHHDVDFIDFSTDDLNLAAGALLLVVSTDPRDNSDHPLATGWNVDKPANDQINGAGDHSPRYVVIPDGFKTAGGETESGMPDDGEFVLILRNRQDRNGSVNDNNIRDVAGFASPNTLKVDNASLFTNLWPLKNFAEPGADGWTQNKFEDGTVHRRQHAGVDGTKRSRTDRGNNADDGAFRDVGWTGIGYKRKAGATAANGGTPGYPNNALQSRETTSGTAAANVPVVIITEVMYATGSRANIPQWIELYNPSKTVGINMDGWRVTIVNHDQDVGGNTFNGDLSKDYGINGKIPPGQTFLLTAYPGRDDTNLPNERVEHLRGNRGELILSQYGFEITLLTYGKDNKDANRKVVDKVGNLAEVTEGRVRRNPQSYEDPAWMLPMGTNDDGDRISIVRVSIEGNPINGQLAGAWKKFDMSAQFVSTIDTTSYGHSTDLSSPGHTVGGVLPVSLSKFRPERLESGEIVVRWITESELDNAGFNILRSETRNGEFTKLNAQLIEGQGTTSERTAYEFVDKTAKPNVVYYYQIQDVSLDGDVTTLRQSRLKGHVSAAGKLTTIWGELKAQE